MAIGVFFLWFNGRLACTVRGGGRWDEFEYTKCKAWLVGPSICKVGGSDPLLYDRVRVSLAGDGSLSLKIFFYLKRDERRKELKRRK